MIQDLHCLIKGNKAQTKELVGYNIELVNNFCKKFFGKKKCVLRENRFSLSSISFPCPSIAHH